MRLFEDYIKTDQNDEMFSQGAVNIHWQTIKENIEAIGKDGLINRQNDIKWHLAENGVTYNVYSEAGSSNRLWDLDPLPLVIDSDEWAHIEKGLAQRAEILDFVLRDIYGERKLIKSGLIPAEIIFAHKNFLRQCNGIGYTTARNLLIYAADLARGPDGAMWVINDKTAAPSGIGYALENRLTLGRVMPDLYNGLHVKRLANFFEEYKELLNDVCPKSKENPLIVILTPGPYNETYFEHAYLASYLGYPLVQGSDLVARDGHLWLKSLKGLKLVDVVLRRVDDDYCDPLELKNDSHLGVAGLLDVVRQKNVTIINPIGSGVLENPALVPFLPSIAKEFFGQELILPQVASWWCGQRNELEFVLDNIDKLIIKRIDKTGLRNFVFGQFLNEEEKQNLKMQIIKQPYIYVGQQQVQFCTTPTFVKNKIVPRNTLWRTFVIAKDNGYKAMPGGLVRVASEGDFRCISNQSGSGSKDVWILSHQDDNETKIFKKQNLGNYPSLELNDLPSLTAENLFWVGRYTSRALFTARYLRMLIKLIWDANHYEFQTNEKCQILLCQALSHITMTYPGFLGEDALEKLTHPNEEILSVILDKTRIGTLAHTLVMLKNASFTVKNLWSVDAWRVFDRVIKKYEEFEKQHITNLKHVGHPLDELIIHLIAFMGLVQESIVKDQGLVLYLIGVQIEESLLSISKSRAVLVLKQNPQVEYELLEAYLSSFESLNTYRYSYKSHLRFENVATMMIFEPKYPKSLTFKINKILKLLGDLPKQKSVHGLECYEKPIFEALSKLKLANLQKLFEEFDDNNVRKELDNLLMSISNLLNESSNLISKIYFSHS